MRWRSALLSFSKELTRSSYFGFIVATYMWWAPIWLRLAIFAVVGGTMAYCVGHSGY